MISVQKICHFEAEVLKNKKTINSPIADIDEDTSRNIEFSNYLYYFVLLNYNKLMWYY